MFPGTLRSLAVARGWSQAEIARRVGVSRQAVSQWLSGSAPVALKSGHLMKLSAALGVEPSVLMGPLPGYGAEHDALKAAYLWDRLYEDLDAFAIAAARWELPAVGRLVEVDGLYAAEKALGRRVWTRFDEYSKHISPSRRRQLQALIQWRASQTPS